MIKEVISLVLEFQDDGCIEATAWSVVGGGEPEQLDNWTSYLHQHPDSKYRKISEIMYFARMALERAGEF
jgi:hypothetical protein